MDFEALLQKAQAGDPEAKETIFRMYKPLIVKNAMEKGVFDEDLFQELSATLLNCIAAYRG